MSHKVPPFHGNISFNAQHAPFGSYFSFTCGHFGTRGGFGLQIGKPGDQDLYIGVKDGDRFSNAPLKVLPFFEGAGENEAARYDVERESGPAEQNVKPRLLPYAKEHIRRHYGWATDRWVTDDFEFTIYTPFGVVPSPDASDADAKSPFPETELRYRLLPAVVATLRVDNSSGKTTKTALFALKFRDKGLRLLDSGLERAVGFALRDEMGFAGRLIEPDDDAGTYLRQPFPVMRWAPEVGLADPNPVHLLGNCPGIGFEVPPGESRTLQLVFGVHVGRAVTTRLEGKYFYTRYYSNLADVLNRAFDHVDQLIEDADEKDRELLRCGLSPDQQFLIAHATRSYYGSTQLLDVAGQPLWVVNEGEYCMMNTLDLAVDQVFWELDHHPWAVRNLLDAFVRHYSYVDDVKDPRTGKLKPGGISFCHDMGAYNQFSPFGHSSYELPNLTGCFSYMTAEQLCNWVLIAACYVARTNDLDWAQQNRHVLDACFQSLTNRSDTNGFIAYDSSRCGESGAEITTYDSLDHSLAQTRNNLYMLVKAWAAHLGLSLLFRRLNDGVRQDAAYDTSRSMGHAIAQQAKDGVLPAVFESDSSGHASRILPAIEGYVYVLFWECAGFNPEAFDDLVQQPGNMEMDEALTEHLKSCLKDPERRNLFPDGGIRLSSTSNNSWMSKIALFQHVAREVFHVDNDPAIAELMIKADAAHVRWQTAGPSAYWACSDQFVSGVAKGSRFYPRVITTALWMTRSRTPAPQPRVEVTARG